MRASRSWCRSRWATRAYDIVIGRGLLASLGERIKALRPGAKCAIVTDETVAKHHLPAAEAALKSAGIESSRHRGAGRRGLQELRHLRNRVRGDHRGAHRARRSRGRARRRRDRRSRRLCRGERAARPRFRAGADDAAGAGRLLGRRQDRHQFAPGQESDRRLPSADSGGRRHRAARHAAEARLPRRLCRGRQIRPARRRRVLRLAGSQLAGRVRRRRRRASTPSRSAAAARPASSRATSARPANARCSISATPSATRWKRRRLFRPAAARRGGRARHGAGVRILRPQGPDRRSRRRSRARASCRGRPADPC